MKKILIPIESVTVAHVIRPLQVAKKLREEGLEIIFGMNQRFRNLVEAEEFEVRPLYSENHRVLLDAVRNINFSKQVNALPQYIKSDLEFLESESGVDAVLGDFRFTLRLAAEHLQIPHIAITNGYFSPYYDVLPVLPSVIGNKMPFNLKKSHLIRKIIKNWVPRIHARPYQKICKEFKLNSWIESGFDIAVSDALTLLCDIPEFTPQRDLPERYKFVGPIMWEPESSGESFLDELFTSNRPLIYLTLGTSGEEGVLDHFIRFFENSPYDVIISTGEKEIPHLPDNMYAFPFVNATDILRRASLMICHGGNGSIYQAIKSEVPIICVASFYDQEWNGQRVEELGMGKSFFYKDVPFSELTNIINQMILDQSIAAKLERYSKVVQSMDGSVNASLEILKFLGVEKKSEVPQ